MKKYKKIILTSVFMASILLSGLLFYSGSTLADVCAGTTPGSCDSEIGQCQYPVTGLPLICGSPTNCKQETLMWGPTLSCITICDCMMFQQGILVTSSYCGAVGMTGTYACQSTGPTSASCEIPLGAQSNVIGALSAGACQGTAQFPGGTGFVNHPPTINLNGPSFMTIPLGQSFTDPWATASDVEDGDLTSKIFISSGFVDVNSMSTFTLTYTVIDSNGASASVSRTVVPTNSGLATSTGNISVWLNATPSSVVLPTNSTTLSWTTSGTPDTCTASGDWSGSKVVSGGSQTISSLVAGNHVFTLTCQKAGYPNAAASTTVAVNNGQLPSVTLSASPTTGASPLNSTLTWSSTNASTCTKMGGWSGTAAVSGSQLTVVYATTTFTMVCSNAYGNDTKSVTITPTSTSGGSGCSINVNNAYGGTITSNDGKISCGVNCTQAYSCGTGVTLNAQPLSSQWKFAGWTGACSGTGSCVLNVGSNYSLGAVFVPQPFNYKEF